MSVRQRVGISLIGAAVAGVFGGAAVIAFQPVHHDRTPVTFRQAADTSTPTETATVTVTPTADPTTTAAPVATTQTSTPVASTQAPAPATTTEAPVSTQPVDPAPAKPLKKGDVVTSDPNAGQQQTTDGIPTAPDKPLK